MTELVRSFAPTLIQFHGKRYLVPPPRVWQALILMGTLRKDGGLGVGDRSRIVHALRDWWPMRLSSAATARGADLSQALALVRRLVLTRTKDVRDEIKDSRDEEEIDWDGLLSDYMAVYGLSHEQVMQEAWPSFLNMARFEGRQRARTWLTYLRAKGIPHMKNDEERDETLRALREQAGWKDRSKPKPPKQPQTPEEQLAAIEALDAYAPDANA